MLDDVIDRLRARRDQEPEAEREGRTSLATSLESHLMAFAAETSRRQRRLIDLRGR
jgi:hypothetical protein